MRHGDVLSQVTIATDPVYLTEPYPQPGLRADANAATPTGSTTANTPMELPRDKNLVPHYLPGKNPWLGEFERKHAMPAEGVRGGAESTVCPTGSRARRPRRAQSVRRTRGSRHPCNREVLPAGEVRAVKVQGNVYLIVGAGANIAAHVRRRRHPSSWIPAPPGQGREGRGGGQGARARQGDPLGHQHVAQHGPHRRTTRWCRRRGGRSTATRRQWWHTRTPTSA